MKSKDSGSEDVACDSVIGTDESAALLGISSDGLRDSSTRHPPAESADSHGPIVKPMTSASKRGDVEALKSWRSLLASVFRAPITHISNIYGGSTKWASDQSNRLTRMIPYIRSVIRNYTTDCKRSGQEKKELQKEKKGTSHIDSSFGIDRDMDAVDAILKQRAHRRNHASNTASWESEGKAPSTW